MRITMQTMRPVNDPMRGVLCIAFALTACQSPRIETTTPSHAVPLAVQSTAVDDVSIMSQNGGNGVTDRSARLAVWRLSATKGNYDAEALIKFKALTLPAGTRVASATMTLSFYNYETGFTLRGYYVRPAWSYASTALGWLNRDTGLTWTVPGARGQGTDLVSGKSFTISGLSGTGPETKQVQLDPAIVQGWIDNPATNQGVLLTNETIDKVTRVYSSRETTVAYRPKLEIEYVAVDTTPPTVALSSPAAGATLSGTVTINASANDAVGVVGVQLLVDGSIRADDTTSPFSFSFDTTTLSEGSHTLAVRARDAAGNTASSTGISVTIQNQAQPPPSPPPSPSTVVMTLTRASGVSGTQRVNTGIPLPPGMLFDPALATVRIAGTFVPTARRVLSRYPDQSIRSVQIQFDAGSTVTSAELVLGQGGSSLSLLAVDTLLMNGSIGGSTIQTPRVWVTLPATWLAASTVFGRVMPAASVPTDMRAWQTICDYSQWNSTPFAAEMNTSRGVWLYDRGTAFFRGYAQTGALAQLSTAYGETDLYRRRILALDGATMPSDANNILMYNYTQNLALHYMLSGDDRFRDAAETVADKSMFTSYTGAYNFGNSQWTERNAGFSLLANIYAARVSDDKAATYYARAATIATNLQAIQNHALDLASAPLNKRVGPEARCFAHTPAAHDASEYVNLDGAAGTLVCSPWMSALSAEGLEAYADDTSGSARDAARAAIVRLGRRLGHSDNRGTTGRPHYLLGVDGANAPDDYDEHWGEVAMVVAMAYYYDGGKDAGLRASAQHYLDGFTRDGTIGHVRSFNWQCRSAVTTPTYLLGTPTAPTIAWQSPAQGAALSGTTTLSATAQNATSVQFLVDGNAVGTADATAPYSMTLDTATLSNGTHTLAARATNTAGQVTSPAVSITVSNTTSPPAGNCFSAASGQGHVSVNIAPQTGSFDLLFSANTTQAASDVVIGLSPIAPSGGFGSYATSVRFFTNSAFDAINAGAYSASATIPYSAGNTYHFRMAVNVPQHVYSVYVRQGSSAEQLLANGFAFRTAQSGATVLNRLNMKVDSANTTAQICDVSISSGGTTDTTPPTAAISAPAAGTVSGIVNVSVSASDNVGVAGVQLLVDGQVRGSEDASAPFAFSLDTATLSNGAHTLSARARDAAGNTVDAPAVSVTVSNSSADNTPPSVSISSPASGAVLTDLAAVTVNATDNVGVAGVVLLVDGQVVGSEDTSAPFTISLDTGRLAQGNYSLTARARDAAGNQSTSVSVAVTIGSPPPANGAHPRIYLNSANRSRLSGLLSAQHPAAQRFVTFVNAQVGGANQYEFRGWYAALLGQLTGNTSYCSYAVRFVDAIVASEEAIIAGGGRANVAANSYLYVGPTIGDVMLTYDWCYNSMSDSQRTRWRNFSAQAVWNVWNPTQARWGGVTYTWTGWSINNPANNYYYSFLRATMLFGLAASGEHPAAADWVTFFRVNKIQNQLVPLFINDLLGGGSREGTGYGASLKELYTLFDLWEGSKGERLVDLTSHAYDTLFHSMHTTVPTLDFIAPIGDHARDRTAALFDYHRHLVLALTHSYKDTPAAGIARTWLESNSIPEMTLGFNRVYDFMYAYPAGSAHAPLSSLNTAFYGQGTGQIYLRSGWQTTASWLSVMAGPYTESHAHRDQGSFMIYKNQWLAYDHNVETNSGIVQEEELHNLVRITGYNQRPGYETSLLGLRDRATYSYVSLDAAPVYANSAVQTVAREIVFVKPNMFIIYDRTNVSANVTRSWMLNTPFAPQISGARTTLGGAATMTIDRVFPSVATSSYAWADGGYRMQAPVTQSGMSEHLHVIGLSGAVTSSTASDAVGQRGVLVNLSDGRQVLARFNQSGPGGILRITQSSQLTVDEPLAAGIDSLSHCSGSYACE